MLHQILSDADKWLHEMNVDVEFGDKTSCISDMNFP